MTVQQRLVWTPRAKARPRTTWGNGGYRTYTPEPTKQAEKDLAAQWVGKPIEGPIEVVILLADTFVEVTVIPCEPPSCRLLKRGDIDNYAKLVMDALNKVAWDDDRQIGRLYVYKL